MAMRMLSIFGKEAAQFSVKMHNKAYKESNIAKEVCRDGTTWYCASLEMHNARKLVPERVSRFKSGSRRNEVET